MIVTLAAQILTLPLIVFSLAGCRWSVAGEPPYLACAAPHHGGGMVTLVVGLILKLLGQIAAVVLGLLTYTTTVVDTLAAVPFASVETGTLGRAAAMLYFVVLLIALIVRGRPHLRPMLRLLAAPAASTWLAVAVVPALLMVPRSICGPMASCT